MTDRPQHAASLARDVARRAVAVSACAAALALAACGGGDGEPARRSARRPARSSRSTTSTTTTSTTTTTTTTTSTSTTSTTTTTAPPSTPPPTTTTAPATTTTMAPPPPTTTTTAPPPPAGAGSASEAALALFQAWSARDRAAASAVATPDVVTSLIDGGAGPPRVVGDTFRCFQDGDVQGCAWATQDGQPLTFRVRPAGGGWVVFAWSAGHDEGEG